MCVKKMLGGDNSQFGDIYHWKEHTRVTYPRRVEEFEMDESKMHVPSRTRIKEWE